MNKQTTVVLYSLLAATLLAGCGSGSTQSYAELSERMSTQIETSEAFKSGDIAAASRLRDELMALQNQKIIKLVELIDQKRLGTGSPIKELESIVGDDLKIYTGQRGERYGLISFVPPLRIPTSNGQTTPLHIGWYAHFNLDAQGTIRSDVVLTPTTTTYTWYRPTSTNPDPFGTNSSGR